MTLDDQFRWRVISAVLDGVILPGRVHSILRPSRIRNEYINTRVFDYVEIENPAKGSQVK